jgi:hypothetical protein
MKVPLIKTDLSFTRNIFVVEKDISKETYP